jgi:hypothetical protein
MAKTTRRECQVLYTTPDDHPHAPPTLPQARCGAPRITLPNMRCKCHVLRKRSDLEGYRNKYSLRKVGSSLCYEWRQACQSAQGKRCWRADYGLCAAGVAGLKMVLRSIQCHPRSRLNEPAHDRDRLSMPAELERQSPRCTHQMFERTAPDFPSSSELPPTHVSSFPWSIQLSNVATSFSTPMAHQ